MLSIFFSIIAALAFGSLAYATDALAESKTSIVARRIAFNDKTSLNLKKYNVGSFEQIKFKPINSPVKFEYDVFYYFPRSLYNAKDVNSLVFLHGGGASTFTRDGSIMSINMYKDDLIEMSEKLRFILVMPSGSGLNWTGHMINYLRDLNRWIRTTFPVNPDKIALSGHSMGGMGITRTSPWLADEYAFFMPVAAGMEEKMQHDHFLSTFFNTPMYHLQGLYDHFDVFITRCKAVEDKVKVLEASSSRKSQFTLKFYDGGHNYDRALYSVSLKNMFNKSSRRNYQNYLDGIFLQFDEVRNDQWSQGNDYYLNSRDSYFWVTVKEFKGKKELIDFSAELKNQTLDFKTKMGGENVKKLRFYLSNKMMDFNKPFKVVVNGKTVYNAIVPVKDMDKEFIFDKGRKYQSYLDITL